MMLLTACFAELFPREQQRHSSNVAAASRSIRFRQKMCGFRLSDVPIPSHCFATIRLTCSIFVVIPVINLADCSAWVIFGNAVFPRFSGPVQRVVRIDHVLRNMRTIVAARSPAVRETDAARRAG